MELKPSAVTSQTPFVLQIASVVHPIAIRFDARFGDAFWWQDKFVHYVIHMMTSWAIVCNVWYLPPMTRHPEESAIAFANRFVFGVKSGYKVKAITLNLDHIDSGFLSDKLD